MKMNNFFRLFYYILAASTALGIVTNVYAASNTINMLSSSFCGIVNLVKSVISLVALLMFIAGGVLYAIGHFLPAAGQIKGSMQGWAMGMIIGGIVGIILVILAQPIVSMVAGFGSINAISCS